jgi:hypothetical protein
MVSEKAASELAIAPFLVEQLNWKNKVLTGDALYCQRELGSPALLMKLA